MRRGGPRLSQRRPIHEGAGVRAVRYDRAPVLARGAAEYIRDLGASEDAAFAARLPPAKLLNLICIFAVFNLPDCAADVALRFRSRLETACSVDRILDLLAAQAQGPVERPLTYAEYLRRFSSNDRMFYGARMPDTGAVNPGVLRSEGAALREERTGRDRDALLRLRALGWTPGVVFDVGASNGLWSDEMSAVYPDAQYHLFEPLAAHVPQYRDDLSKVLRRHERFVLHPVALGGRVGELVASRFPNPFASTTLPMENPEPGTESITVPVTTIDEIVVSPGLPHPGLLKIDVQGAELAILQGARQVLPSIDALLLETGCGAVMKARRLSCSRSRTGWRGKGFALWDFADTYRDRDDVLNTIDCVFINTRSMASYVTYRTYRADLPRVTGARAFQPHSVEVTNALPPGN